MSKLALVPGPTQIARKTLNIYAQPFDSCLWFLGCASLFHDGGKKAPDLDEEFFRCYCACERMLLRLLKCQEGTSAVVMSGEAMVVLWGAIKSVVLPGDVVVCLGNGVFGDGFVGMVEAAGGKPLWISFPYNEPLDMNTVRERLKDVGNVKLITAVHCETPSGAINNNLGEIGKWCREEVGALFLVDFVASAFGADVRVGDWNIDLGLLGTQKALSLPPDLGVVTVSTRAWKVIEQVNYRGYDAILPFKSAVSSRYMPYTHNWRAVASLTNALERVDLDKAIKRHERIADYTRRKVKKMGLCLYCPEELAAPTVTAVVVPEYWNWPEMSAALRAKGVIFGGSYGSLKGKVFRIGHMGTLQTKKSTVKKALKVLKKLLRKRVDVILQQNLCEV